MADYLALVAKVDAFVGRVEARHGADLACGAGCASCCLVRLTIAGVEADAIAAWLAARTAAERAEIAAAAMAAAPGRCAALADDDRCRIYPVRPLVCRSHGVPIRLRRPGEAPVVTACALNFTAHGPAAAAADCVLDQELVSTTLGVIDRAAGGAPETRVDLTALLVG
ncbi:MAG: YkgJ family cysteine cluster protein [Myxococcales bacterium]|nr:YkgJ family cysteine cluster protein [Myxococcales bacterium]